MSRKYKIPHFLHEIHDQKAYGRWLHPKAIAHVKRDRERGNASATVALYKQAIHAAVCDSGGNDFYTGETLDWSLLSKYSNEQSKESRRLYKSQFRLLPSVDHVGDGLGAPAFKICAWRTNDCKNDLSYVELLEFCEKVIAHAAARA